MSNIKSILGKWRGSSYVMVLTMVQWCRKSYKSSMDAQNEHGQCFAGRSPWQWSVDAHHGDCLLFMPRTFVNTFIQFRKPIVVAVNGPVVGLAAAILPLCDVVWANEKAWFQTPYSTFGQTPDACSSITFPRIMGMASVSGPSADCPPII